MKQLIALLLCAFSISTFAQTLQTVTTNGSTTNVLTTFSNGIQSGASIGVGGQNSTLRSGYSNYYAAELAAYIPTDAPGVDNVGWKFRPFWYAKGGSYDAMILTQKGNLLINTATAADNFKLAVNGDAIATRMVVKLNANWPDYVFKSDYELPPLSKIALFIKENGHLPEIPSAQEVADNGIDVGSMNEKLLKKVEELTLYLIEQQKQIDALKEAIKTLKN